MTHHVPAGETLHLKRKNLDDGEPVIKDSPSRTVHRPADRSADTESNFHRSPHIHSGYEEGRISENGALSSHVTTTEYSVPHDNVCREDGRDTHFLKWLRKQLR